MKSRLIGGIAMIALMVTIMPTVAKPTSGQEEASENPGATYPESALKRHAEGTVKLKALVGPDGLVQQASVVKSSGRPDLDNAAIKAIKSWHYKPALRDGEPVPGYVLQVFEFSLSGEGKPTQ